MTTFRPRPQLHFTPPRNWINDPNGPIRIGSTYHLYYQHNPDRPEWGNLHWGHATSDDLLGWQHHPIALAPDGHGLVFSGSTVVDTENTAGFGVGALVAIFTQALPAVQHQCIAYSTDDGETWAMFDGNPVLSPPDGVPDFRDPKVVRFQNGDDAWWVMLLGVGSDVWLYRSDDLRTWERTSTMRFPSPWPDTIVEVPDLMRVPVVDDAGQDTGRRVWTLIASLIPPGGGRHAERVRYVPVDFDGTHIVPLGEEGPAVSVAFDVGADLYAPMAWDPGVDAFPIVIGWMDDNHADDLGDPPWRGRMSLPRKVWYQERSGDLSLWQEPTVTVVGPGVDLAAGESTTVEAGCFALTAHLGGQPISIVLASGTSRSMVEFDGDEIVLRTGGGDDRELAARLGGPTSTTPVRLDVIVDVGSIEVFADGRAASAIVGLGLGPTSIVVEAPGDVAAGEGSVHLRVVDGTRGAVATSAIGER